MIADEDALTDDFNDRRQEELRTGVGMIDTSADGVATPVTTRQ